MAAERIVFACVDCPFSDDSIDRCKAKTDRGRSIPYAIDVDRERPKWCPLPVVVRARAHTGKEPPR